MICRMGKKPPEDEIKRITLEKERLEMALSGAELGLWDWFIRTGEVLFSNKWMEMLGYAKEETEPHVGFWENLIHPKDKKEVMEALQAHLKGETSSYRTEHRLRMKNGDWKWVLDSGKVSQRDDNGNPVRMTGLHMDIDHRKKAEEKILEERRNLITLFETISDLVFVVNETGEILFVNQAVPERLGYAFEQMKGTSLAGLYFGEDQNQIESLFAKGWKEKKLFFRGPLHGAKGEEVFAETVITKGKWDGQKACICISRDVSERIAMEKKLLENEEKFRKLFHANPAPMGISRVADGRFMDVNQAFLDEYGYAREEVLYEKSVDLGFFDEKTRARMISKMKKDKHIRNLEMQYHTKNRGKRYGLFSAEFLQLRPFDITGTADPSAPEKPFIVQKESARPHADGKQTYLLSVMIDITERKRAIDALSRREKLLTVVSAAMKELIISSKTETGEKLNEEQFILQEEMKKGGEAKEGDGKDELQGSGENGLPNPLFYEKMSRVFQMIGEAMDVDRMYLFENHYHFRKTPGAPEQEEDNRGSPDSGKPFYEPGGLLCSQRFEWAKGNVTPQIDNPDLQNVAYAGMLDRWVEIMRQGKPVAGVVEDFPESERQILEPQDIVSLLAVPIILPAPIQADEPGHPGKSASSSFMENKNVYPEEKPEEGKSYPFGNAGKNMDHDHTFWGFVGFDDCHRKREWTKAEISVLTLAAASIGGTYIRYMLEKELVKAKERAEASSHLKSEFLNVMSHELRTPLTVMLGNLPLLTDTDAMPEPEEVKEIAQDIEESGKHLLTLINDLLDISKIEAGKMEISMQRISAKDILHAAQASMAGLFRQKGLYLQVELEEDFFVSGDPVRIHQILLNLAGNALKFTEKGGVTIKAWPGGSEPGKSGFHYFQVADTGVGMKEEDLPHIFDVFRQVDSSSTRKASGTGLGLGITKKLVMLHGGEIRVKSRLGQGSVFTFTLPKG